MGRFLIISTLILIGLTPAFLSAQAGSVEGTVVDPNGDPMVAVKVSLRSASGGEPALKLTDSEGRFIFKELSSGSYGLECSTLGFKTIKEAITVTKNKAVVLAFRMEVAGDENPSAPK